MGANAPWHRHEMAARTDREGLTDGRLDRPLALINRRIADVHAHASHTGRYSVARYLPHEAIPCFPVAVRE
jgi:hypothetical protein